MLWRKTHTLYTFVISTAKCLMVQQMYALSWMGFADADFSQAKAKYTFLTLHWIRWWEGTDTHSPGRLGFGDFQELVVKGHCSCFYLPLALNQKTLSCLLQSHAEYIPSFLLLGSLLPKLSCRRTQNHPFPLQGCFPGLCSSFSFCLLAGLCPQPRTAGLLFNQHTNTAALFKCQVTLRELHLTFT